MNEQQECVDTFSQADTPFKAVKTVEKTTEKCIDALGRVFDRFIYF